MYQTVSLSYFQTAKPKVPPLKPALREDIPCLLSILLATGRNSIKDPVNKRKANGYKLTRQQQHGVHHENVKTPYVH